MRSRSTNLALLVLLLLAFVTGGLAYALGTAWATWVVFLHGAVGLAIVLLTPWKSAIVDHGMRRRTPDRWLSVAFGVLVIATVVTGIAHAVGVTGGTGQFSALWLHVAFAIAALPLAVWHVVARPIRPRRGDVDRRTVLRAGAVLGGAIVARAALDGVVRATGLPGADRRFTGSHEVGTDRPGEMPVTMWFDDSTPDRSDGTVTVGGREWTADELAGFDDTVRATLDCTGGWYATQDWTGARLSRLVGDAGGGRSVHVTSRTGYARLFPLADIDDLLLATHAGGEPLSAGHGAPARLVAPGRRGFWWVKWVERIEVSDRPAWLQLPFPPT